MARRSALPSWIHWTFPIGGGAPGGSMPGTWVRTRNDPGAKQFAKEREKDMERGHRRRGSWRRELGIFSLFVLGLGVLWLLYRLLF